MEQFHGSAKRKTSGSGGLRKPFCHVKRAEIGGPFTATKVGEEEVRVPRKGLGRKNKNKLKKAAFVNVLTKEGMKKARIRTVTETPDNKHYARQNVITKGAVIDTELGKVKVTNRVGQDGVVNGVLL